MLPNWLYGKSKSKLASILGGGGGTPADYNQVKAQVNQNTENIALLSDALDNKASLTQITNPNLLDNPWFTVNQRGQNRYNANNAYTVDRWLIKSVDTTKNVTIDNAITLDSGFNGSFCQRIDNGLSANIMGKNVTLSVLLSDGSVVSSNITLPSTTPSEALPIGNKQITGQWYERLCFYDNFWHVEVHTWGVAAPTSLSVKAVKLELGSVSTLAMDTAPNYATELLKCQRYFYKTLQFEDNGANISPNQCLAVSTTRLQGIKFPTEMRANPTITINKVNELDSSTALTGVTSQWASKEGISYFSIAGATVGNLYIIDFEASAEL